LLLLLVVVVVPQDLPLQRLLQLQAAICPQRQPAKG
jgi:hypothetical protein